MFTRILVPTDFSEPSDAALEYARAVADTFGASLHLLHVFELPRYLTGAFGPEMFIADAATVQAELMEEANRRLQDRVTPNDRDRHAATTDIVVGQSAPVILEYATGKKMDLIVMGTHGRSGVSHVLMGSVAEKVVRAAPCPVMTVRRAPATTVDVPKDLLPEWVQAGG